MVYSDGKTNSSSLANYHFIRFVYRTYKGNHEYQIYSYLLSCSR